ncbi:MAG: hypothetical protein KDC92_17815, partial [Bacteroidetes bacterium]|nr:hypothetical protein [Bacteroidota bacterium]
IPPSPHNFDIAPMPADKLQNLDEELIITNAIDRRTLLPFWMKIFCWLFMALGVYGAYSLVMNLWFGPPSPKDDIIYVVFIARVGLNALAIYKGFIGFGLWFRKPWAPNLGIIDALLSMAIALVSFYFLLKTADTSSRFTSTLTIYIVMHIPYLMTLFNIRKAWADGK